SAAHPRAAHNCMSSRGIRKLRPPSGGEDAVRSAICPTSIAVTGGILLKRKADPSSDMTMASPQSASDSQKLAGVSSHDRILGAAKHLFATRGYESTSTVAIARAAGTSESQLIKHFGSKEGLLEAIFDMGWERMSGAFPALQPIASPAERLEALLEMMLSGFERDQELKQLMLLEGRRIRKEGHMVMLTGGYKRLVEMADSMLGEMK